MGENKKLRYVYLYKERPEDAQEDASGVVQIESAILHYDDEEITDLDFPSFEYFYHEDDANSFNIMLETIAKRYSIPVDNIYVED